MIEQDVLASYGINAVYDGHGFDKCPEFVLGSQKFVVCDEEGADIMVQAYRDALLQYAYNTINENFEGIFDYVDFDSYAEDSFQSIYDIYDNVIEYTYNNKLYYICYL